VVKRDGHFEMRDYDSHILAETLVDGDMEDAGNKAFRKLFRYISGRNQSRNKIAMTAPVSQSASGEKIAMTAPVGQKREHDKWVVSFMMPSRTTMESLPVPNDSDVKLRQVPARRMAALKYSGTWSKKRYTQHKEQLQAWIEKQSLTAVGEPEWARYDPPFKPWFLRRNEILIPVASASN
jgi:hypothetical protein